MTRMNRKIVQRKATDLVKEIRGGDIDLETDYQRDVIWTKEDQSLLIDSIMHNIDIPKIYLAEFKGLEEVERKKYECVDGKQRITSMVLFREGKLKWDNREYDDLSPEEQNLFDTYEVTLSIFEDPEDDWIYELFKRLNLGDDLNYGEKLHAKPGEMKKFIFEDPEIGDFCTKISVWKKRYSRESTVAQMLFNSNLFRGEEFRKARVGDLEKFLDEYRDLSEETKQNLSEFKSRIKDMAETFGDRLVEIRGKASVVSTYLFYEEVETDRKEEFVAFCAKLAQKIGEQREMVKEYNEPDNKIVLSEFQKYIDQASVEAYSIWNRHKFLETAFEYYLSTEKIIGENGEEEVWTPYLKELRESRKKRRRR